MSGGGGLGGGGGNDSVRRYDGNQEADSLDVTVFFVSSVAKEEFNGFAENRCCCDARACVRAVVRACVRACVRARVRACVCVCVCERERVCVCVCEREREQRVHACAGASGGQHSIRTQNNVNYSDYSSPATLN